MEARIVWLIWSTLGAILIAATSKQATDELKAWMPWIIDRLIDRAVQQLPADDQERYDEEWRSHVRETPGDVGKLIEAIGCVKAAQKMVGRPSLSRAIAKVVFDVGFASVFWW